jgi:ATP-dependent helicase/nuclease subunit B
MNGFLEEVVSNIAKENSSFEQVLIIVPSQRAGLYTKHLLAKKLNKTILSPSILTVQSFIQQTSQMELVDPFELIFVCYEAYQKISVSPDDFTKFMSWAPTLIQDFNDIDHYLLDPKMVFSNLSNIKEIDEWSFNAPELSEGQEQFQLFWDLLFPIYQLVNEQLTAKRTGYQGQITRLVAENMQQLDLWKDKTIYVVGVNALTAAEEIIIKALKEQYNTTIYWDNDSYYINNLSHEAGVFQRKFADSWAPEIWGEKKQHFTEPKVVRTYESTGNVAQVKLAGQLLTDWKKEGDMGGCALVLADENLLIPTISSLPNEILQANITMGYPAGQSATFQFFNLLLNIQEQYIKQENSSYVHHRLFRELFSHPILRSFVPTAELDTYLSIVDQKNLVQINLSEVHEHFSQHSDFAKQIMLCLHPWATLPNDCFTAWETLTNELQKYITHKIDKELLFMFSGLLKKLNSLTERFNFLSDLQVVKSFIQKLISKELIPFFGEPLEGLQIMGMLETRALDFEKIIILSVNEGVLPKGNNQSSFIPYELKRYYQLPTHFEGNAIYAYHFYRLIQRAKEVHLVYNTAAEGINKGEKSRFITQLELEYPNVIDNYTIDIPFGQTNKNNHIQVTESLSNNIATYLNDRGLSPSALNTFLRCPKDFALKYLFNIREPELVEENLKDNSIGTIVHEVLENLFTPVLNRVLTIVDCENMLKKVPAETEKVFHKEFPYVSLKTGVNYLALEVAKKQLTSFLKRQIKEIQQSEFPITVLGLEKKFNCTISVDNTTLTIKGVIDRIDRVGNQIRVLDYKTGKVDPKDLKLTKTFGDDKEGESQTIFKWDTDKKNQLLFYLFAAFENKLIPDIVPEQLSAGIIALNNVSNDAVFFLNDATNKPVCWSQEYHELVHEALLEISKEINQPNDMLFEHIKRNSSYCLLCEKG